MNGKPVATAVKVDGDRYEVPQVEQYFMSYFSFAPSKLRQSSYGFEADFREGDKVRIEAEADGHAVWSEVIVPKAPEFEVADTSYAVDPDSYYESQGKKIYNKLMKIRLKGRDNIDGPNHYRLWGTLKSDDLVYLREFNRDPDEIPEVKTDRVMYETGIRIRWKNDPILNDGPQRSRPVRCRAEHLQRLFRQLVQRRFFRTQCDGSQISIGVHRREDFLG